MEHVMQVVNTAVTPFLVTALLGVLRWGMPKLKEKVPGFMWPMATIFLSGLVRDVCGGIGVNCSGDLLQGDPTQAAAFVDGMVAIVMREFAKWVREVVPAVESAAQKVSTKLSIRTPPPAQ